MRRGLLFIVVFVGVSIASDVFAQGRGGSGGGGAPQQTVITKAIADLNLTTPQVTIHGDNFGVTPTVLLGDVMGTQVVLVAPSVSNTVIVAELPVTITAGTYTLTVQAGAGQNSTGIIDVTIGTQGLQGLPGTNGADGAAGIARIIAVESECERYFLCGWQRRHRDVESNSALYR